MCLMYLISRILSLTGTVIHQLALMLRAVPQRGPKLFNEGFQVGTVAVQWESHLYRSSEQQ